MNNGLRQISQPRWTSLLGGIADDARELLLRQVATTKLEVRDELRNGLTAAMGLGIGLGIVAGGGMLLMLMLVQGLAVFTVVPLWACYGIAGSALVVLGGVVLAAGRAKTEKLDSVPRRVAERIDDNAPWLTKQTTLNEGNEQPVKISRTPIQR